MTFSLFKLPFLALKEVLLHMEISQIVDLSFCSKKSQRIVRNSIRKRFHATVHFGALCSILLLNKNSGFEDIYSIMDPKISTPRMIAAAANNKRTINGVTVSFCLRHVSIWENMLVGCLFFAGHFITLFGNEGIEKMKFMIETEADLVLMVDWIQKWKPTVKSFEVIWVDKLLRVPSELVESLLQNLNVTENLKLLIPSRKCGISRKLTLKSLELISNCTFESLLNVDSEDIRIGGITSLDLNKFLMNWKNGGSQKLKILEAKFQLDWSVLTNGITRKRFRNAQTVTYFSMENVNGEKANIKIIPADHSTDCYREKIEFVVQQEQPDIIEL